MTAIYTCNTQHVGTIYRLNCPPTSSSSPFSTASYSGIVTSIAFTTFSIGLAKSYTSSSSIVRDFKMYNINASTNKGQEVPRSPQTTEEEIRELKALSIHRLGPRYTNDHTVNQLVHLDNLSLSEHFQSDQNRRPIPGLNRNILHAAAIFDPGYQPPPPITYQLPPRAPGYDADNSIAAYTAWESHQRNDSGYESAPYTMMDDDEEDDEIDAWCDAVVSQGTQLDPNQHVLRPEAPCFEPQAGTGSETQEDDFMDARSSFSPPPSGDPDLPHSSIRISKRIGRSDDDRFKVTAYDREVLDYEGLSPLFRCGRRDTQSESADSPSADTRDTKSDTAYTPSGYTRELFHGNSSDTKNTEERKVDDRFKVTDYELEVLDYDGFHSKIGRGVRDTQSEIAGPPPGDTRDTQSDTACPPFGHSRELYHSSSPKAEDAETQKVDERFKVTDYELEVLDYEGCNSKFGQMVRDTQSERALSEGDDERDEDRPSLRYQWSFSL